MSEGFWIIKRFVHLQNKIVLFNSICRFTIIFYKFDFFVRPMDLEQVFSHKSDENNVKIVVIIMGVTFYRFFFESHYRVSAYFRVTLYGSVRTHISPLSVLCSHQKHRAKKCVYSSTVWPLEAVIRGTYLWPNFCHAHWQPSYSSLGTIWMNLVNFCSRRKT